MFPRLQVPRLAFGLVLALLVVSQLGETVYLPALPAITQSLACSSSLVQSLLGWFLLAYGVAQFIYGPLSDYYGRRLIILASVALFLVGAIFSAKARDCSQLVVGCLVMGAGIGSGGLMCRTVLRDLYTGVALQKASSIIGVTLVFMPLCAPIVGAYCLLLWDWRAIFWLMAVVGALLWITLWFFLAETNPYVRQQALHIKSIWKDYRSVVANPSFRGNALCVSANCAALMAYEAVMPFLLQERLGYTPLEYGVCIILPVGGFLVGSLWSFYLTTRLPPQKITRFGIKLTALAGLLMLVPGLLHHLSIVALLLPAFLFMLGSGLLFPTTTTGALSPFPRIAGVAGASLGGLQNICAGLGTLSVSWLPVHNQIPMAITMLCLVALCQLAIQMDKVMEN